MTDTTARNSLATPRRFELEDYADPEGTSRAAATPGRRRGRHRAAVLVVAMLAAWASGSSTSAFAVDPPRENAGTADAAADSESAVSPASTLAKGLLATIPPGSRLAVRPLYERETRLPPDVGKRLYELVLKAVRRSAPQRQVTVLTRERLRKVYVTLDNFGLGDTESMLRAAQTDIEVICEPFPFAAGVTLSCGAVDLNSTVNVAHAEARFAIERPVWRLDLAVTDIAGRLADGAPEAGAIDRARLTDASVGHGSTDLGAHVAGLLEAEVLRLMADRARREGNDARAKAVLATAPEEGETPRYRLTGTLRPLDRERMRLEVRLAHEDRTLLAAGADIAVSSLPPRLVEGQAGAGGTTPVAGRMYEAVAEAVVSGRLDRDSARRAARNLARARVVSQALGLPPPPVTEVRTEADAVVALGGLLDAGLPVDERFREAHPEGGSGQEERVAVRLAARVVPVGSLIRPAVSARLDRAVYKAMDPIGIEIRSDEKAYLGVFAWGADNRVVRLYPQADSLLVIGAGETVFLPRRSDGIKFMSAPLPERGNREDHEAFVIVATPNPLDYAPLAAQLVTSEGLAGTMKRAVDGSGFLAALAGQDPARMAVIWLPYSVHE